MKKIKLEKINSHLQEELKNKKFKKAYEVEVAKVSLAQRIAELKEEKHLNKEFITTTEKDSLPEVPGMILSKKNKREIEAAVKKTVKEYGQTLRLLGNG